MLMAWRTLTLVYTSVTPCLMHLSIETPTPPAIPGQGGDLT